MTKSTVIPFTSEHLIVLPVVLAGPLREIEVHMVVDTGATYTMIPWKIAQALGLNPERAKDMISITTASTSESVPLITIPTLSIAANRLRNVKAVAHDLPSQSRVDGLIGLNVLNQLMAIIDFSKRRLMLP